MAFPAPATGRVFDQWRSRNDGESLRQKLSVPPQSKTIAYVSNPYRIKPEKARLLLPYSPDTDTLANMPASKQAHVLAILRKNLGLKQIDLAKMVSTSLDTIQSVETNRLALSKSLAERISAFTGADLAWLLANDLSAPMPPPVFSKRISTADKEFMRGQILMNIGRAWAALSKLSTVEAINLFNHFTWDFWDKINNSFGEQHSSLESFELLKAATLKFHPQKWLEQQAERQAELRKKKKKEIPKKLPPVQGLP